MERREPMVTIHLPLEGQDVARVLKEVVTIFLASRERGKDERVILTAQDNNIYVRYGV